MVNYILQNIIGGGDITIGKQTIKNIEYENVNTIKITVIADRMKLENVFEKEGEEEHTFTLIYEDFEWKFSDFHLIAYDF
ncbi:MAG: hypothetical protein J6C46_02140 [Clostridia bacterium]|nr:hypothetical protein [Clostridia bacterium]